MEIVEEPVEGEGLVTLWLTQPGLYLILDLTGEVLESRTRAQQEASMLQ